MSAPAALEEHLATTVRHERRVVAVCLALLVALAWLYLWHDATMMAQAAPNGSLAATLTMAVVMWTVMMVGMMLPSAAPAILVYASLVRRHAERGSVYPATWTFVAGYLAVWAAFSLGAAILQVSLQQARLLTPALVSASPALDAAVLIAAGVYQFLPFKDNCLRTCWHPLQFFLARWRGGTAGALRMGAELGTYCVGCCWALMLVLLVAGVMNLVWVALIAGFVLAEKLLPGQRIASRLAGAGLVAAGFAVLALA